MTVRPIELVAQAICDAVQHDDADANGVEADIDTSTLPISSFNADMCNDRLLDELNRVLAKVSGSTWILHEVGPWLFTSLTGSRLILARHLWRSSAFTPSSGSLIPVFDPTKLHVSLSTWDGLRIGVRPS